MKALKHTLKAAATSAALMLAPGPAAAATVAAVDDETGHAVLLAFRGNCYAVLPDHVAASNRITLVSTLPRRTGVGTVFQRNPSEDLALAYVEGELAAHCALDWNDLRSPVGALLADPRAGAINRINFGGAFMDRVAATVFDADQTHFYATTTSDLADGTVESGVSGALFTKGNTPVGMALTAETNRTGRFVRMDRIHGLFDAVLSGKAADHPATKAIGATADGLGFRVTGQAVMRDGAIQGLPGAMQWPWTGAPIEIELTLSNEKPVPLNKIMLRSAPSADRLVTAPQRLQVELDVGAPGSAFWRALGSNDMPPSGILEIPTGGTHARRIRLRIESVWHPNRAVQLDTITLE